MGKSEFKSGNLKGIHQLGGIVEVEETIVRSFLKVSGRWCRNVQWIALGHSRGTDWPLWTKQ